VGRSEERRGRQGGKKEYEVPQRCEILSKTYFHLSKQKECQNKREKRYYDFLVNNDYPGNSFQ
jgi:hypothetical protein